MSRSFCSFLDQQRVDCTKRPRTVGKLLSPNHERSECLARFARFRDVLEPKCSHTLRTCAADSQPFSLQWPWFAFIAVVRCHSAPVCVNVSSVALTKRPENMLNLSNQTADFQPQVLFATACPPQSHAHFRFSGSFLPAARASVCKCRNRHAHSAPACCCLLTGRATRKIEGYALRLHAGQAP